MRRPVCGLLINVTFGFLSLLDVLHRLLIGHVLRCATCWSVLGMGSVAPLHIVMLLIAVCGHQGNDLQHTERCGHRIRADVALVVLQPITQQCQPLQVPAMPLY